MCRPMKSVRKPSPERTSYTPRQNSRILRIKWLTDTITWLCPKDYVELRLGARGWRPARRWRARRYGVPDLRERTQFRAQVAEGNWVAPVESTPRKWVRSWEHSFCGRLEA